jgi:hypothetical protein
MIFLVVAQFSGHKAEAKSINQKYIYLTFADEKKEKSIQQRILKVIPKGAKVLNLCPNAYPFFNPGYYKSESRFFVFWSNFESAPIKSADIDFDSVDYVIACNTYLYQGAELNLYNVRKNEILRKIPGLISIVKFGDQSFNWEIFRSTELDSARIAAQ